VPERIGPHLQDVKASIEVKRNVHLTRRHSLANWNVHQALGDISDSPPGCIERVIVADRDDSKRNAATTKNGTVQIQPERSWVLDSL